MLLQPVNPATSIGDQVLARAVEEVHARRIEEALRDSEGTERIPAHEDIETVAPAGRRLKPPKSVEVGETVARDPKVLVIDPLPLPSVTSNRISPEDGELMEPVVLGVTVNV